MKPDTLKALKGSIRKWKRIVAGEEEDRGPSNCPLCVRFLLKEGVEEYGGCSCMLADGEKCPVYLATGNTHCMDSPYDDWEEAIEIYARSSWDNLARGEKTARDNETVMCAVLELEFLKSLLPAKEKE